MQTISRSDARALGLIRYFTGKPCPRGHVCERYVAGWTCVACTEEYLVSHREEAAERSRLYYKKNRDACLKQQKEYAQANREKVLQREKARREANPNRFKDWCSKNPDKVLAIWRNRRARKRAAEGSHTGDEIKTLFAKQKGKCAHSWCRSSLRTGYHADHIIPLKLGGSNWISNIQLLCEPCNLSKGAKHPIDFMQSRGLLL